MKFSRRSLILPLLGGVTLLVIGWAAGRPIQNHFARPGLPVVTPAGAAAIRVPPFTARSPLRGVPRLAQLHTERPERPRFQVMKYTIQKGDTAWSLAQRFDLKIESILWGNEGMSADAGALRIGQEINILPVDGVLHTVKEGETLDTLSLVHGAPVDDIVAFIGNGFPEQPPYEIRPG